MHPLTFHPLPLDITQITAPINQPGSMQLLPFHMLGEVNFERLCTRLAQVQPHIIEARQFGTKGQRQDGIDVLARLDNSASVMTYQCKCYLQYTPGELAQAVYEFLYKKVPNRPTNVAEYRGRKDPPENKWAKAGNSLILCVACEAKTANLTQEKDDQIERLKLHLIGFEVWDQADLTIKLQAFPEIILDFFNLEWVEQICGRAKRDEFDFSIDQIITLPTEAVVPKTPSGALRSESRIVPMLFRKDERREIVNWLRTADTQELRVFIGPGGVGKTRFFLEVAKTLRNVGC